METLLISACLLGVCCRYDGDGKLLNQVESLRKRYHLLPVCPEILGGLPTPRPPAERLGERVITQEGAEVTSAFQRGAAETLRLCRLFQCQKALLKERSPSCGKGLIYDGTFSQRLTAGNGVAAQALIGEGVIVYGESQVQQLLTPKGHKAEQ